jgi:Skp family chaperone for outer membrane proteins/uncharacterized coiled-coil protein SlyX
MDNRKITWPFAFAAILLVFLSSGFIFDWGKKKAKDPNQMEAAAKQEKRLTAQDEKIAELNRKIDEQGKLLAAKDKRFDELAGIMKKLDEIQASFNTPKVDINDSDMSMIQDIIEKQVKLNVRKAEMPKIGVVSLRKIFRDCKRTVQYRQEVRDERQRTEAEENKLNDEIQAQKAGLRTLKIGSESYMAQVKEILEKQASLQAKEEFNKQQRALKEQRITEKIYGDILRITGEVAKEKGLDLVFEASEPKLPASSPTELELSMGTHKLLYGGGCSDITDEVIRRLDSEI